MTRSFLLLLVSLLFGVPSSLAGIAKGFQRNKLPSLDQLPHVGQQYRKLATGGGSGTKNKGGKDTTDTPKGEGKGKSSEGENPKGESKGGEGKATTAPAGSKAKETESSSEETATNPPEDNTQKGGKPKGPKIVTYAEIPEAAPQFTSEGELSFVILMDDFGYSSDPIGIGTKFAYSGRIATNEFEVGNSTGTCTVTSDIITDSALCTFHLSFDSDGDIGSGTVTLTGTTDAVGGHFEVTGAGADLASIPGGYASCGFDPAGNAIMYLLIKLFHQA